MAPSFTSEDGARFTTFVDMNLNAKAALKMQTITGTDSLSGAKLKITSDI